MKQVRATLTLVTLFGCQTRVTSAGSGRDKPEVATKPEVDATSNWINRKYITHDPVLIFNKTRPKDRSKSILGCECGLAEPRTESSSTLASLSSSSAKGNRRHPFHRIAGGFSPQRRPWMAYLLISDFRFNKNSTCGAALINRQYLLTAAHCFCDSDLCMVTPQGHDIMETIRVDKHVRVVMGLRKINLAAVMSTEHVVESIKIHEKYDNIYYDLALIRLKKEVAKDGTFMPICLPDSRGFPDRAGTAQVAGWGHLNDQFCTTDDKGPAKHKRCQFPFSFDSVEYSNCASVQAPGVNHTLCKEFQKQRNTLKPAPKFPVKIIADDSFKICYDNKNKGTHGWCRTDEAGNVQGYHVNKIKGMEREKTSSENKNWGWCKPHCSKLSRKGRIPPPHVSLNLMETQLNLLDREDCSILGQYTNPLNNQSLKVSLDMEICAAQKREVQRPEVWKREKGSGGKAAFKRAGGREGVRSKQYYFGGSDACRGDSGGPLWVWVADQHKRDYGDHQSHAFLIGVVSRGDGCTLRDRAGVYTRVKVFLDWIESNVKSGNCKKEDKKKAT